MALRLYHNLIKTRHSGNYYYIYATMSDSSVVTVKRYRNPLQTLSGIFDNITKANVVSVEFTENLSRLTSAQSAFKNMSNLQTIVFAQGTTLSALTNANEMFRGCSSLDFSCIDNFLFDNVLDCGFMFSHCSSSNNDIVLDATFEKATTAINMFNESRFNKIQLDNATFESVEYTYEMFKNSYCNNLILPVATFESVKNASGMFLNIGNLQSLSLPSATFEECLICSNMIISSTLRVIDLKEATFAKATNANNFIEDSGYNFSNYYLDEIYLNKATFAALQTVSVNGNGIREFIYPRLATTLVLPSSGTFKPDAYIWSQNFSVATLEGIADWLYDYSGDSNTHKLYGVSSSTMDLSQQDEDRIVAAIHAKNWQMQYYDF